MKEWHAEARRRHAAGEKVGTIAAAMGKARTTVRVVVDPSYRDMQLKANRDRKALERAEDRKTRIKPTPAPRINYSAQAAYAEKLQRPKPGLAKISLPEIDEVPVIRKFAPRTRWTASPGAERWRQHNLAMIRAGKIPARGLVEEMSR